MKLLLYVFQEKLTLACFCPSLKDSPSAHTTPPSQLRNCLGCIKCPPYRIDAEKG